MTVDVDRLKNAISVYHLNWCGETLGENATRDDLYGIIETILAALRETHAIVPREPTEAMWRAAETAIDQYSSASAASQYWQAMIAASEAEAG